MSGHGGSEGRGETTGEVTSRSEQRQALFGYGELARAGRVTGW
jgi:hypothetical protein